MDGVGSAMRVYRRSLVWSLPYKRILNYLYWSTRLNSSQNNYHQQTDCNFISATGETWNKCNSENCNSNHHLNRCCLILSVFHICLKPCFTKPVFFVAMHIIFFVGNLPYMCFSLVKKMLLGKK